MSGQRTSSSTPHRPSCAARLRERAEEEQWSLHRTVDAIVDCCGVSRLRAHRLARGWTLRTAVAEFRMMCTSERLPGPRLDEDQLRIWETHRHRRPRAATVDLLCRLYQSNSAGLGLAGDYESSDHTSVSDAGGDLSPWQATERAGDSPLPTGPDPLERLVDDARRSVDRTLARATVSSGQLDLLEERLLWLRQQYIRTAPIPMLGLLLQELGEVDALAAERQPAAVQVRLSEMTALLATLVADALMKLGRLRQSRAWYATARTAADDSGSIEIRARVRAQAAMLPYYYGPLESAAALAREARLLVRGLRRPSATGAFAAAAEARALARQGDEVGAHHAIEAARTDFEHSDHGPDDDAFAFPERRFLLYLSGAYTFLGRSRQARAIQRQALALYADRSGIDPALLRLEEALCLAREHNPTEACQLASATYLQVPQEHRTPILSARAQHIIDVLPPLVRSSRAVRDLGEILALPSPQM